MKQPAARSPAPPLARAAIWLFVALSTFYVGLTKGHFEASDQVCLYQTSQGIWERNSLHTLGSFTLFGGRWVKYSPTSHGVSVLALPFYGLGKVVDRSLAAAGTDELRRALAGPVIEVNPTWRWGGEVPMFFVNLFPAFTIAALCLLFLFFNCRLGVSPRWALAAAVLLGTCSYLAYQGAELYQHGCEALFLLVAVFFLFEDARNPSAAFRWVGGFAAGALFLCRWQALIAIPVLFAYLAVSATRRHASRIARESFPFVLPVLAAIAVHFALNYAKFHVITFFPESAANEPYHFHFLRGLYGLIASPGAGVLLFCPLVVLLPWTAGRFHRRFPSEAWLLGGLSLVYLGFYANFDNWHGQWCFGPRFLTALIPLWFLPLGGWMESRGRRSWKIVAPLAIAGLTVVLLGAAVNFSYQYYAAGYANYKPLYGFVYSIRDSQLVTNARAILAGNHCVDLWLVQIGRTYGLRGVLLAATPLAALLALAVWRLVASSRRLPSAADSSEEPGPFLPLRRRRLTMVFASILAITAALWAADPDHRSGDAASLMRKGMDALYARHDPAEAAEDFRGVLRFNPDHYGATYQLANALDLAGERSESRVYWTKALEMAKRYRDEPTINLILPHLQGAVVR